MSSYYRGPYSGGGMTLAFPPVTPMVKIVLIVLASVFMLHAILGAISPSLYAYVLMFFGLHPELRVPVEGPPVAAWQLVTYALLHGGLMHILFNALGLWMFGGDVERVLGSRGFLRYLVVCVVGGGLAVVAGGLLSDTRAPTVGISGGVLGLVLAFAVFFPDRQVYIFPIPFPVKAWVMALVYGLMNVYGALSGGASNISYAAHLGGLAVGYLYLKGFIKPGGWSRFFARRKRHPFRVVHGSRPGPYDVH